MAATNTYLTIFTAPKPFTDAHIRLIQRNAILSWHHLGDEVDVILVGDEPGMAEFATETGLKHLPQVERNAQGTPLVSSIFELARQHSTAPLLAYVNADILVTPGLITAARQVADQAREFLIVGQRWDLDVRQELDFSPGWDTILLQEVKSRGRLHPPGGSDYFIFPRQCFTHLPVFAIGRAGWDNWMFYHARLQRMPVVDATASITVIHQDHDYAHLPGGKPHYHLPESHENIRLAGGRRAIFTLLDADHMVTHGRLQKIPLRGKKLWRYLETLPLVRWKSAPLAELFFAFFHPARAFGEWRGRLAYHLSRSGGKQA